MERPAPSRLRGVLLTAIAMMLRLRLSEAVIDQFIGLLPRLTSLAPDRRLLVLDGRRPELCTADGLAATEASNFALIRRSLIQKASASGFGVFEVDPVSAAEHRRTGLRFEFEADAHWGGEGLRGAAEAVMASELWRAFRASGPTAARH